ncbi:hypothetical protein FUSO6_11525 [Fusobacterium necrophorum DAB]|uniref:hypothetical protein n=1 Tax=Fusobacterium necrophorum TaxID=859 RepID=UPI000460CDA8|nr:hypothetical protein [Fusobacterium necrophorum]KDE66631.1 hypothetical protein FUSO6_11525 [Fusobacterium necrophorum DAB]KDE66992.1 hypothetical protein FUSO5_01160 [Fusobacterium necrophorum BFTR-1]KDE72566.1 hypothetical protein FUSO7_07945 [Fusobacterium necrophorum BFTR-2]MBR8723348.1 hypothetical protein [Fusobacterium necrophorum subsp. funduliforme]MBR8734013.1 hypothetical protein [Fusobacterium necrophorum]
MARYELGAIYKIAGGEKTYYARLLTDDVYGIFEPIFEEICQKTFENAAYRLYISTGSFAVKRGFWEKILSSPDKTDVERWSRPPHLVRFTTWDIEGALERCLSFDQYGHTEVLEEEDYIAYLKQGFISIIQPMYENIPSFLNRVYENWPQSYICEDVLNGTLEHQKRQISALKKIDFDVTPYE